MEADPAVSNWIELEDEAEALKARVKRMERRVSFVRNQPLANLTEASAYHQALCLSPPTSPCPEGVCESKLGGSARLPVHKPLEYSHDASLHEDIGSHICHSTTLGEAADNGTDAQLVGCAGGSCGYPEVGGRFARLSTAHQSGSNGDGSGNGEAIA